MRIFWEFEDLDALQTDFNQSNQNYYTYYRAIITDSDGVYKLGHYIFDYYGNLYDQDYQTSLANLVEDTNEFNEEYTITLGLYNYTAGDSKTTNAHPMSCKFTISSDDTAFSPPDLGSLQFDLNVQHSLTKGNFGNPSYYWFDYGNAQQIYKYEVDVSHFTINNYRRNISEISNEIIGFRFLINSDGFVAGGAELGTDTENNPFENRKQVANYELKNNSLDTSYSSNSFTPWTSDSVRFSMNWIPTGDIDIKMVALDKYGNQIVVAEENLVATYNFPLFETCSFSYSMDTNLGTLDWGLVDSASFISSQYHVQLDGETYQVFTRYPVGYVYVGNYQNSDPINSYQTGWFNTDQYWINNGSHSGLTFLAHGDSFEFPISIIRTSDNEIMSQCFIRYNVDLEFTDTVEFHSVEFDLKEELNIEWNITTNYEAEFWDLCWSDAFFLSSQIDTITCNRLEHELDPYGTYSILDATLPDQVFCNPNCPSAVYATLIASDLSGNKDNHGVLGIFELIDSDGDGVPDGSDVFPNDANESEDSDGDGIGDNGDVFPNDSNETLDTDGDGVGDNGDKFPFDSNETIDSDGDGVGDNGDLFPLIPSQWEDNDGDGFGDNTSGENGDPYPNDFDNDGVIDSEDAFPLDANESLDTDGDGIGDEEDEDDDGDGILDVAEKREGSDPKDPNSLPPESFEIALLGVTLGTWDLLGIVSGLCLAIYLVLASVTRDRRYENYDSRIESSHSFLELEDISKKLERLQMLRLLGVRHVMRLEKKILARQTMMSSMESAGVNVPENTFVRDIITPDDEFKW